MSQWVQSKYSKDAKKWELTNQQPGLLPVYAVHDHACFSQVVHLPKAEYILCDPPERWETCTREVVEIRNEPIRSGIFGRILVASSKAADDTRWAWSEKDPDALVIQRKVRS